MAAAAAAANFLCAAGSSGCGESVHAQIELVIRDIGHRPRWPHEARREVPSILIQVDLLDLYAAYRWVCWPQAFLSLPHHTILRPCSAVRLCCRASLFLSYHHFLFLVLFSLRQPCIGSFLTGFMSFLSYLPSFLISDFVCISPVRHSLHFLVFKSHNDTLRYPLLMSSSPIVNYTL